jgi:acetoin utilization deacetylase AcuC-like enzyme
VREYRPALAQAIEFVGKFRPAFAVLAFGADAHEADPIGGFKLPTGYFREIGVAVRELGMPTVVTQEGGYNLDALGPCVAEVLRGLTG